MCLFKRDSEEAIGTLACHHQTSNKRQVVANSYQAIHHDAIIMNSFLYC